MQRHVYKLVTAVAVLFVLNCGSTAGESGQKGNQTGSSEGDGMSSLEFGEVSRGEGKADTLPFDFSGSLGSGIHLQGGARTGTANLTIDYDTGEATVRDDYYLVNPGSSNDISVDIETTADISTQKLGFALFEVVVGENGHEMGRRIDTLIEKRLREKRGWLNIVYLVIEEMTIHRRDRSKPHEFEVVVARQQPEGGQELVELDYELPNEKLDFLESSPKVVAKPMYGVFPIPYQPGSTGRDFWLQMEGDWDYKIEATCGRDTNCLPPLETNLLEPRRTYHVGDDYSLAGFERTFDEKFASFDTITVEKDLVDESVDVSSDEYIAYPREGEVIEVAIDRKTDGVIASEWPEGMKIGFVLEDTQGERIFGSRLLDEITSRRVEGPMKLAEARNVVLRSATIHPEQQRAEFVVAAQTPNGWFHEKTGATRIELSLSEDDVPSRSQWSVHLVPYGNWANYRGRKMRVDLRVECGPEDATCNKGR